MSPHTMITIESWGIHEILHSGYNCQVGNWICLSDIFSDKAGILDGLYTRMSSPNRYYSRALILICR